MVTSDTSELKDTSRTLAPGKVSYLVVEGTTSFVIVGHLRHCTDSASSMGAPQLVQAVLSRLSRRVPSWQA